MKKLPKTIEFNLVGYKVRIVHGSYTNVGRYVFKSTDWKVKSKEFRKADADIIIGGHCGLPFSDKRVGKLWFNPGVIGMPANDSTPRVWYGVVELVGQGVTFKHHSFKYDYEQAAQVMKKKNLPKTYQKTLKTGIWDNCEILPEAETRQQGQPLCLTPIRLKTKEPDKLN